MILSLIHLQYLRDYFWELHITFFLHMTAMLRNEVGWFDEEDNSADTLSMRLANDATFVRAAFSNRLSIFIQDSAAVIVAVLIGMLLEWRYALVALATLPFLTVSAIAQVLVICIYFLRICYADFFPSPLIYDGSTYTKTFLVPSIPYD